jgi:hypothetical protein
MAANKIVLLGPVFIANAVGNLFSPPTLTGGTNPPPVSTNTFYILRHISIVNKDTVARTFTLYKDATGGSTSGKEIIGGTYSIAANSAFDKYCLIRLSSDETDKFITGVASAASVLVIEIEAEIGVV